jgi:1,4-alpha-glucan branching enzyme
MTSGSKDAAFRLYAPQAKKVSVAGSFNKWSANKLMAKKDGKGSWMATAKLRPGRYEYKFVVDGKWINDPQCSWLVNNSLGSQNCVIEIR